MDLNAVLADLRKQFTAVNDSIAALERIGATGPPRRGRPPKWMARGNRTATSKKARGPRLPDSTINR